MNRSNLIWYKCADLVSAVLVWLLFYIFRRVAGDFALSGNAHQPLIDPSFPLLLSVLFYAAAAMGMHYLSGYYNRDVRPSRIQEFFSTLIDSFFLSVVVFFALLLDDKVTSYHFYYQLLLLLWGLQFLVTYLFRLVITSLFYFRVRQGLYANNTLVIGTGPRALEATESMQKKLRRYGTVFKGYLSVGAAVVVPTDEVLGELPQLEEVVKREQIDTVVIAVQHQDRADVYALINRLIPLGVVVRSVPGQLEIVTGSVRLVDIDAEPFVSLTTPSMPAWQQSMKRVFDVVASSLALVFLSPLLLYIVIRMKWQDGGVLIYKQERIGKHGKVFNIYKFRTMCQEAEQCGPQLSSEHDTRITKFGRVMRRYRMDELPQFWNVIKGDMSIVGPRPERKYFIDQICKVAPYYCLIYKIQPGLVSWGPIKIGYSDSIEKMVRRLNYDMVYMENMSLLTDLKIILYSVEVVLRGKGV